MLISLHNVGSEELSANQWVSGWGLLIGGGTPPLPRDPAPQARGRAVSCRLPSREGRSTFEKKSRNGFVCADPVKGAATGTGGCLEPGDGARGAA